MPMLMVLVLLGVVMMLVGVVLVGVDSATATTLLTAPPPITSPP